MFKITPVSTSARQNDICLAVHTAVRDNAFAYEMTDAQTGALLGMSQFEIEKGHGVLFDLRPADGVNDFEAMFILGRQTLNFIDLCGVHTCEAARDSADERLLKCVGFRETENGVFLCDMMGMFDGHCSGQAKTL